MRVVLRLLALTVLAVQLSCNDQGQSEVISNTVLPDSGSNLELDLITADKKVDTVFSVLQGSWKLLRKYTPSGKSIKTDDSILLTVRDSLAIKTSGKKRIWADTLFRGF